MGMVITETVQEAGRRRVGGAREDVAVVSETSALLFEHPVSVGAARPRTRDTGWPVSATVIVTLLAVYAMGLASIGWRPAGTEWSAWWPASGVAVAVAARLVRRRSWLMAVALGGVSAAASFTVRQDLAIALGAGLAISLEVWVGAAILRGSRDRMPRLNTASDLARLFTCAVAAALTAGVVGGAIVGLVRGPDAVLAALSTTALAHATGILLVAPLLLWRKRDTGAAGRPEAVAAWAVLTIVVAVAFGMNIGLPIAFTVIVPLTWAAARLARRSTVWMLLLTAGAVAVLSVAGRGPFATGSLDAPTSVLMVQVFDLALGITFLTLAVFVTGQRRLSQRMRESEILFHATFDSSLVGTAIVRNTAEGPAIDRLNGAGRSILGAPGEEIPPVGEILDCDSLITLLAVVGGPDVPGEVRWQGLFTTRAGRTLETLLSRLPGDEDHDTYNLQFLDVTERVHAQDVARADLDRASEVQRALLPKDTAPLDGYDISGGYVPATSVGGDFYDWYPVEGGLAFSLGDVMGKGVGAGMIAATIRATLRSARRDQDVTVAVARAADTLDTDAADIGSFATLFHGRLSAEDGVVDFADAGHGLTIILGADGTVRRIESEDVPLGAVPGSEWTGRTLTLQRGDTLIAVSDGVLDLYDGTLTALDQVVYLARHADSPQALTEVIADLARWADAPDDVTILAIRRN
jgi:sigma-B regulation protein RsbU (phosphoserine phosphatase)